MQIRYAWRTPEIGAALPRRRPVSPLPAESGIQCACACRVQCRVVRMLRAPRARLRFSADNAPIHAAEAERPAMPRDPNRRSRAMGWLSMRADDCDLIDAIDRVLSVPLPASGTQSATVRGIAAYAADMRSVIPLARQAVMVLRQGASYPGHRRELLDELHRAVDAIMDRVQQG